MDIKVLEASENVLTLVRPATFKVSAVEPLKKDSLHGYP